MKCKFGNNIIWRKFCPSQMAGNNCQSRSAYVPAITVCVQTLYPVYKARKKGSSYWEIRKHISDSRETFWNNFVTVDFGSVSSQIGVSWDDLKSVLINSDTSWSDLQVVSINNDISWNVNNYDFDGTFYLERTNPSYLPADNSPRSMFGWVMPNSTTRISTGLFGYGPEGYTAYRDHNFLLYNGESVSDLDFWSNGSDYTAGSLVVGEWNMVGMTWDGEALKLYINNSSWTYTPPNLQTGPISKFRVGIGETWNYGIEHLFTGHMADVGIWNRTITDEEIGEFYTLGPTNYHNLPTNLKQLTYVTDATISSKSFEITSLDVKSFTISNFTASSHVPVTSNLSVSSKIPTVSDLQVFTDGGLSIFTVIGDSTLQASEYEPLISDLNVTENEGDTLIISKYVPEVTQIVITEGDGAVLEAKHVFIGPLETSGGTLQIKKSIEPTITTLMTSGGSPLQFGRPLFGGLISYWNLTGGDYDDKVSNNHLTRVSVLPTFTYPTTVAINSVVNFTDTSILASSWYWDFGDGNTSTDQNPTHTYSSIGTYLVTLTINNVLSTSHNVQVLEALLVEPMNGETLQGTLYGVAYYDTINNYIRLTEHATNRYGAIDYDIGQIQESNNFTAEFDFWALGNADAIWLYLYTENVPTDENSAVIGYQIVFDEWRGNVVISYSGDSLATVSPVTLGNGVWNRAKIVYNNQNIQVYMNGTHLCGYDDSGTPRSTSSRIGLGGRCGAESAEHRVRNLIIYAN